MRHDGNNTKAERAHTDIPEAQSGGLSLSEACEEKENCVFISSPQSVISPDGRSQIAMCMGLESLFKKSKSQKFSCRIFCIHISGEMLK